MGAREAAARRLIGELTARVAAAELAGASLPAMVSLHATVVALAHEADVGRAVQAAATERAAAASAREEALRVELDAARRAAAISAGSPISSAAAASTSLAMVQQRTALESNEALRTARLDVLRLRRDVEAAAAARGEAMRRADSLAAHVAVLEERLLDALDGRSGSSAAPRESAARAQGDSNAAAGFAAAPALLQSSAQPVPAPAVSADMSAAAQQLQRVRLDAERDKDTVSAAAAATVSALRELLERKSRSVAELEARVDAARHQLESERASAAAAREAAVSEAEERADATVSSLRARIAALEAVAAVTAASATGGHDSSTVVGSSVSLSSTLASRVATLELELADTQRRLGDALADRDKARAAVAAAEARIAAAASDLATAEADIDERDAALAAQRQAAEEMRREAERDKVAMSSQLEDVRRELEAWEHKASALGSALRELKSEFLRAEVSHCASTDSASSMCSHPRRRLHPHIHCLRMSTLRLSRRLLHSAVACL